MNNKKIILIIIILLCCGCSAKYELNFVDDKISENLTVTYSRDNITDDQIKNFYSNSFYAIGREELYNFDNSKSTKKQISINLNYDYNVLNYNSSNIANSCFTRFQFLSDDDKYYIFANGPYKCLTYEYISLNAVDIIITTNHKVLENNADEIKNGKYLWHIDQDNYENASIKFITDRAAEERKFEIDYKTIFIVTSITLSVILILSGFLFVNNRRVNKI